MYKLLDYQTLSFCNCFNNPQIPEKLKPANLVQHISCDVTEKNMFTTDVASGPKFRVACVEDPGDWTSNTSGPRSRECSKV